jgi:hypothetical protein
MIVRPHFLLLTILAAMAASPAWGQDAARPLRPAGSGAQGAAPMPDFSGIWSHPSFPGFEQPASGFTKPAGVEVAADEDRQTVEEYTRARQRFEEESAAYWTAVTEKRLLRTNKRRDNQQIAPEDYVLTQPPVYAGPPKPVDPSAPISEPALPSSLPVPQRPRPA